MAYDYNSQDNRFDFPNPYRIENLFYFCAAGTLIIGGILLLLVARGSLSSGSLLAMSPLVIGVAMLVHGLAMGAKAMSRLRFFFGRGQPESMAQNLTPDQVGTTDDANALKDLLRHSSLVFREPTGPLNGVLYSLFPNLIFSPQYVQTVAQRQFQNALAFLITLLSLVVSLVGTNKESVGWLGLFYFGMALFILLKPIEKGAAGESGLGFKGLVGLILLAILGPVVIPMFAKGAVAPEWLPSMGQAAIVMMTSVVAIALFFRAVLNQSLKSPPHANMAVVQDTLTMNSHPKQILDELERRMQDQWVASLPNRRYARRIPEVLLNAQSGSFDGELLEETQPVPDSELKSMTWKSCFSEPRFQWLGWLNSYGIIMMLIAVVSMIVFAEKFFTEQGVNTQIFEFATLGISMWTLGSFCFRAGNVLWGRFDFLSKLIWVEMKGNYQSAQMDYGNQFTDKVKTQKQVINIESMTLRVWIAEIETVTFGKDARRTILGMRGLKDEAEGLHAHLKSFGQQQSMIVAPTSGVDLQRANALGVMNQLGKQGNENVLELPAAIASAINKAAGDGEEQTAKVTEPLHPAPETQAEPECLQCKPSAQAGMKFCPDCGSRLMAA
jgi:hypothetical protein